MRESSRSTVFSFRPSAAAICALDTGRAAWRSMNCMMRSSVGVRRRGPSGVLTRRRDGPRRRLLTSSARLSPLRVTSSSTEAAPEVVWGDTPPPSNFSIADFGHAPSSVARRRAGNPQDRNMTQRYPKCDANPRKGSAPARPGVHSPRFAHDFGGGPLSEKAFGKRFFSPVQGDERSSVTLLPALRNAASPPYAKGARPKGRAPPRAKDP